MPTTQTNKPTTGLNVTVMASESIIYEGKVEAISSNNDKGPFDLLHMHSNFICIIKDYLILHEFSGKKKEMKIKNGVMKVYQDQVSVFLGIEG